MILRLSQAHQAAAIYTLIAAATTTSVSAHGYLKSPRSRNWVAHDDLDWSAGADPNYPAPESEPWSANIGGVDAQCGIIQGRNYDTPKNAAGGDMDVNVQACYQPGSIIDLNVVLTAHHKGHFEFRACPLPWDGNGDSALAIPEGGIPNQACFDAHPLTFIEDVLSLDETRERANFDPHYPERAYIPLNDSNLSYKFELPAGLSGDLVLIQWYYVTANSCMDEGYDTYNWPVGFHPGNVPICTVIPPDGRGTPEQFWNCAEVRIAADCQPPATTTATPATTGATGTTSSIETTTSTTQVTAAPPNGSCPAATGQCGPSTTCADIGHPGLCCSQWGWCGSSSDHCGTCCQNGPCDGGAPPPSPPTASPPPPGFNYDADHGEDSRLIAYAGNWQACPTAEQVDAYSHIVIAFATSYTWASGQNNCDAQCNVASTVPICNNQNNQALVDSWRAAGKKVILSFGGAGMGGSWSGDSNNCWDYCFGEPKTEALADELVNIVDSQNFDGIDIDYEYCYDIGGAQAGRCSQRTAAYSDAAAQAFLDSITSKLRTKLDVLQASNGYNRGRYELTHAPMDSDLTPDRPYFQILHNRRADLDFLMPQFYNGVTRPAVDGIDGAGAGALSAASMFGSLANDMFDSEPHKVVFGHCISDCGGTGSNVNSAQAVQITADLKTVNNGEFSCNGGAFFWVSAHDTGGAWSDAVVAEVSKTAGCSHGSGPSTTTQAPPTSTTTMATEQTTTTTQAPPTTTTTTEQTTTTQAPPTTTTTTGQTTTTTQASPTSTTTTTPEQTTTTTAAPPTTTTTTDQTTASTTTTSTTPATTTSSSSGELILSTQHRCGTSGLDAREHCKPTCLYPSDCPESGESCFGVHANFCGSYPQRVYTDPVLSSVWSRCGKTEVHARTFCGDACSWNAPCTDPDDTCQSLISNYCGSDYTTDDGPVTTEATTTTSTTSTPATTTATTPATTTTTTNTPATTTTTTTQPPPTTTTTTTQATTTTTSSSSAQQLVINQQPRCGVSELDARERCNPVCAHNGDCLAGQWCWGVYPNYCGSRPQKQFVEPARQSTVWHRCGTSEINAREFCGEPCSWSWQCTKPGESCVGIHSNYCDSVVPE